MKVRAVTGCECMECGEFNPMRGLGKGVRAWRCPTVEEVTLEKPRKLKGAFCPHCSEFIDGAVLPVTGQVSPLVCELCEDDEPSEEEEHEEVRVWVLDCGCINEEAEKTKWFRCGECDELHEDRDEALECCRDY
jgi:hypothetical protein